MTEFLTEYFLVRTIESYTQKWFAGDPETWAHAYVALDTASGGYPYLQKSPETAQKFRDRSAAEKEATYMTEHSDYECEVIRVRLVVEPVVSTLQEHILNDHRVDMSGKSEDQMRAWHLDQHFRLGNMTHWHESPHNQGILYSWNRGTDVHYRPEWDVTWKNCR